MQLFENFIYAETGVLAKPCSVAENSGRKPEVQSLQQMRFFHTMQKVCAKICRTSRLNVGNTAACTF